MLVVLVVLVQLWSNVFVWNVGSTCLYEERFMTYKNVSEMYAGEMAEHMNTWRMMGCQEAEIVAKKAVVRDAAETIVKPVVEENVHFTENKIVSEKTGAATGIWSEGDAVQENLITGENISSEHFKDSIVKNTENDLEAGRTTTDEIKQKVLELDGFVIDENGIIKSCKDPAFVSDGGIVVFPVDERCMGIGSEALDGIASVEEIYIPANITFIAPGVLEKLEGLMYIEVAPDNPVYESRDGILYSKSGELITIPSGRE